MTPSPTSIDQSAPVPKRKSSLGWVAKLTILLLLIGLAIHFDFLGFVKNAESTIASLGVWGPVAFIGLYILATVFFIPGSALTIGAGLLFGVFKGFLLVSVGSTLGAALAFLIGRHFARDWVAKKIDGKASFKAIDEAVGEEGWKIVGLTRLSPVFPFALLNYAYGLTKVSFRDFFFASWIGMMPGTFLWVYLGAIGKAGSQEKTPMEWIIFALGLAATVIVTIFVTKIAKKALAQKVD